ncbi:hypothetical protein LOC68_07465 [Blastopirellula sp. JC732]|uniref:Cytochrome c domain-containing protein n=1 Tax=Blastopirellula sediminis TaxID=2894196 RepID=A0A9X1SIN4_9BACT|nr:hypothetical protein [Blastopirellula sediminis]MCC9608994.1 hypothetical protein [Blastopirellula sediminis]MCC9628229.1 hypothetical protein [Blastopirellula sediminis]
MKKVLFCLILGAIAVVSTADQAYAIKPFMDVFVVKYNVKEPSTDADKALAAAVAEVKCNLCHEGKSKKDRNAYGVAMDKLVDKKEITELLKADKDKGEKTIEEVFVKLEAEKSPSGETYGELLKAGKLPVSAE